MTIKDDENSNGYPEILSPTLNPLSRVVSNISSDLPLLVEDNIDNALDNGTSLSEEIEENGVSKYYYDKIFDWKLMKFNIKPNFYIYMFFMCLNMGQDLFFMTTFLDLQLDKITNGNNVSVNSETDYLSFMKWSGVIFTFLQMYTVSRFGVLLDVHGIRFSALLYFVLLFFNGLILLYTMSNNYTFALSTYYPLRIVAALDGGSMVLMTIVQSGITDLFSSHEQRNIYFNYLLSGIAVITCVVPFLTSFFIKKFGKFTVLKVNLMITVFELVAAYLILNDSESKPSKTDSVEGDDKNMSTVAVKRIKIRENSLLGFFDQFKVLLLPKTDPVARRNVLLLTFYKILSTIQDASSMVIISYLMIVFKVDSVQLNYMISFVGFYGSICSFGGIKLFYYVTTTIFRLKHSAKTFDRIDNIQLLILSIGSVIQTTVALIQRHSLAGIILMFLIATTTDFCKPVLTNTIVKYVENRNNDLENNNEELECFLSSQEAPLEHTSEKTKTGSLYACFSILDKMVVGVTGVVLFQIFQMTKDDKPWFFLVFLFAAAAVSLLVNLMIRVDRSFAEDEDLSAV